MSLASLESRTCLVTGANRGIGHATALGLARRGATVLLVSRNPAAGEAARQRIVRACGHERVELFNADLADQASIRRLADEVKARHPQLHVLVNNAAVLPASRLQTPDGIEMQFAVNHLAYFLLTHLLLDRLRSNTPARIVNVSSEAHRGTRMDFDDLQLEARYSKGRAYARSKLANVLFTFALADRLQGTGVTANCLHPGVIATNLLARYMGLPRWADAVLRVPFASPARGARTSIYLACSPDVEGVSGKYFKNCREHYSSEASHERDAAERLWKISAELTGLGALV